MLNIKNLFKLLFILVILNACSKTCIKSDDFGEIRNVDMFMLSSKPTSYCYVDKYNSTEADIEALSPKDVFACLNGQAINLDSTDEATRYNSQNTNYNLQKYISDGYVGSETNKINRNTKLADIFTKINGKTILNTVYCIDLNNRNQEYLKTNFTLNVNDGDIDTKDLIINGLWNSCLAYCMAQCMGIDDYSYSSNSDSMISIQPEWKGSSVKSTNSYYGIDINPDSYININVTGNISLSNSTNNSSNTKSVNQLLPVQLNRIDSSIKANNSTNFVINLLNETNNTSDKLDEEISSKISILKKYIIESVPINNSIVGFECITNKPNDVSRFFFDIQESGYKLHRPIHSAILSSFHKSYYANGSNLKNTKEISYLLSIDYTKYFIKNGCDLSNLATITEKATKHFSINGTDNNDYKALNSDLFVNDRISDYVVSANDREKNTDQEDFDNLFFSSFNDELIVKKDEKIIMSNYNSTTNLLQVFYNNKLVGYVMGYEDKKANEIKFNISQPSKIALRKYKIKNNNNQANCKYNIQYTENEKTFNYDVDIQEVNKWYLDFIAVDSKSKIQPIINTYSNITNKSQNIQVTIKAVGSPISEDCKENLAIQIIPIKEYIVNNSGRLFFYDLFNPTGSRMAKNQTINIQVINPQFEEIKNKFVSTTSKDNYKIFANEYFEYIKKQNNEDVNGFIELGLLTNEELKQLDLMEDGENGEFVASKSIYVRTGQVIRFDYSTFMSVDTLNPVAKFDANNDDFIEGNYNIGRGLIPVLKVRPALFCIGEAKEKVAMSKICSSIENVFNSDTESNNQICAVDTTQFEQFTNCITEKENVKTFSLNFNKDENKYSLDSFSTFFDSANIFNYYVELISTTDKIATIITDEISTKQNLDRLIGLNQTNIEDFVKALSDLNMRIESCVNLSNPNSSTSSDSIKYYYITKLVDMNNLSSENKSLKDTLVNINSTPLSSSVMNASISRTILEAKNLLNILKEDNTNKDDINKDDINKDNIIKDKIQKQVTSFVNIFNNATISYIDKSLVNNDFNIEIPEGNNSSSTITGSANNAIKDQQEKINKSKTEGEKSANGGKDIENKTQYDYKLRLKFTKNMSEYDCEYQYSDSTKEQGQSKCKINLEQCYNTENYLGSLAKLTNAIELKNATQTKLKNYVDNFKLNNSINSFSFNISLGDLSNGTNITSPKDSNIIIEYKDLSLKTSSFLKLLYIGDGIDNINRIVKNNKKVTVESGSKDIKSNGANLALFIGNNSKIYKSQEFDSNTSENKNSTLKIGSANSSVETNDKIENPDENTIFWLIKYQNMAKLPASTATIERLYDESSIGQFDTEGNYRSKTNSSGLNIKTDANGQLAKFITIVKDLENSKYKPVFFFKILDTDGEENNNNGFYDIKITSTDSIDGLDLTTWFARRSSLRTDVPITNPTAIFSLLMDMILSIMDGRPYGIPKDAVENPQTSVYRCNKTASELENEEEICFIHGSDNPFENGNSCDKLDTAATNNCFQSCDVLLKESGSYVNECNVVYNNGGLLKSLYTSIIQDPLYQFLIKIALITMLTLYGFGYFLGLTEFNQKELMSRLIKVSFIYALISPIGWDYYYMFAVSFFKQGIDSLLFIIASSFEIGENNYAQKAIEMGDYSNKLILFASGFVNLKMLLSEALIFKLCGLAFSGIFGLLRIYLMFTALMTYIATFINAIILYLTAQLFLSFALGIGPLVFLLMFYERTKKSFDNWLNILTGYAMQQIFLITTLSFFNNMMYIMIKTVYAYTVCVLPLFSINLLGIPLSIIHFYKIPGSTITGSFIDPDNQPGPTLYAILTYYIFGMIMSKFVTSMTDLGAEIGGGISATKAASAITGAIDGAAKAINSVAGKAAMTPISRIEGAITKEAGRANNKQKKERESRNEMKDKAKAAGKSAYEEALAKGYDETEAKKEKQKATAKSIASNYSKANSSEFDNYKEKKLEENGINYDTLSIEQKEKLDEKLEEGFAAENGMITNKKGIVTNFINSDLKDIANITTEDSTDVVNNSIQPPAETASIQPPAEIANIQPPAEIANIQPPAETTKEETVERVDLSPPNVL